MEDKKSHPIPQDVTGFQFKLIGDMTVKQFAYLAGPIFLAWIFFQLPVALLIKIPVSLVLGGIGASLAFLPVAGRPMDMMIVNFIKALFKSTLYIYQKKGMHGWAPTITSLNAQKINIQKAGVKKPQVNKSSYESRISEVLQVTPQAAQTAPIYTPPAPTYTASKQPSAQQDLRKAQVQQEGGAIKKKVADLDKDLEAIKKETELLDKKQRQQVRRPADWHELNQPSPTTSSTKEALDLQKQLQAALIQKEQLTEQLMALQQKLDTKKESFFTPTVAKTPPKPKAQTQNVRQVPKSLGKQVGLPTAPEAPNIVTGIIKDPRGNPLGNILVEIKDAGGNPVRAFKTNGLGQFASATPLTNGTYTISFEDPKGQNKFDAIEFVVKNEVILPLEVISVDTREELRKTLFKNN